MRTLACLVMIANSALPTDLPNSVRILKLPASQRKLIELLLQAELAVLEYAAYLPSETPSKHCPAA